MRARSSHFKLIALVILAPTVVVGAAAKIRHSILNRALISAIKKGDDSAAIHLLDQGADAN